MRFLLETESVEKPCNYHVRGLQQRGQVRTERERLPMVVFPAAADAPQAGNRGV